MNSLFSLQSCTSEKYLRRSFQPSSQEQIGQMASRRFVVILMNTAWSLHSYVFQVCLAIESSVKIAFSLLSFNYAGLKTNCLRFAAVPVNLFITTASALSLPLALLMPETSLSLHQMMIGCTQITSSFFQIKNLEAVDLCCASHPKAQPEFTHISNAEALLALMKNFPEHEDLFLVTRAVNHYWQALPHLLQFTCTMDENSYKHILQRTTAHLSSKAQA